MAADHPEPAGTDGQPEPAGTDGLIEKVRAALHGGVARYTPDEIALDAGVPRDLTRRLWRAMGFADVPDEEVAFGDSDLEALRRTSAMMARDGLDTPDILHLARVLGQSTSRMADSVVTFSAARRGTDRSIDTVPQLLNELDHLVVYLLNRHLLDALQRYLGEGAVVPDGTPVTVGFADLVGFTQLSLRLGDIELAAFVEDFETLASDTVVANGGRVVKMIGDEVMFTTPSAQAAIEIALLLAEAFADANMPGVRVGLASGRVLTRAGDLFGPTVNLAARATTIARPGSVLVSEDLFDLVESEPRYRLRRLRPRRLAGIGWAHLGDVARARPPTE